MCMCASGVFTSWEHHAQVGWTAKHCWQVVTPRDVQMLPVITTPTEIGHKILKYFLTYSWKSDIQVDNTTDHVLFWFFCHATLRQPFLKSTDVSAGWSQCGLSRTLMILILVMFSEGYVTMLANYTKGLIRCSLSPQINQTKPFSACYLTRPTGVAHYCHTHMHSHSLPLLKVILWNLSLRADWQNICVEIDLTWLLNNCLKTYKLPYEQSRGAPEVK